MKSSNDYTGGNEKSGFSAWPQTTECEVGLALNMQYVDTNHPTKRINFMSEFHGGVAAGGGHRMFDQFLATSNHQVKSRTLFKSNAGLKVSMFFVYYLVFFCLVYVEFTIFLVEK